MLPSYVPVTVCVATAPLVGVYVTEHLELSGSATTGASVHGVPGLENVPVPLVENDTVPDGFDFVPPSVSSTVAVQVVGWLTTTEAGEHETVVAVERFVTVTASVSSPASCFAEPPYSPFTVWTLSPADGV